MKTENIFIILLLCFLFTITVNAQVKVTINVIPPPNTSPKSQIYIVGDNDVLGNWDPAAIPMTKVNDTLWTFVGQFPERKIFQFKITRGSWQSQAMFEPGNLPENILKAARPDMVYWVKPLFWSDEFFKPKGDIIGNVQYHEGLTNQKLKHSHDVIVLLPPSYNNQPNNSYPVIYMNDGQNIIDPKTATKGMEWKADETLDSLVKANKMQEAIIVGIYHSPDREFEYINDKVGKAYGELVVKTVKPFIDKTYRTQPDRDHTAIMGSAMGGLSAFWIAWNYPTVFKNVAALSGTFNLESDKLLKEVGNYKGPFKDLKIYLDMGGKDLDVASTRSYNELIKILNKQGYKTDQNLKTELNVAWDHNEDAWSKRLPTVFEYFFGI